MLNELSGVCANPPGKKLQRSSMVSSTDEYRIWQGILQRCLNPSNSNYPRYGGAGISVSDEWSNSFDAFLRDMGSRPSKQHSVDRKNNALGYSAENCKWATLFEQQSNKNNNVYLSANGESKTIAQWSRDLNISSQLIWARKKAGKPDVECLAAVDKSASSHRTSTGLKVRGKSGFKGVSQKDNGVWVARITSHKKNFFLGIYESPIDAAMAYDAAALRHFGKNAVTNFSMGLL